MAGVARYLNSQGDAPAVFSIPAPPSGGAISGTPTQTSVSVLNSSTKVLDANTAKSFIKLKVNANASNGVWVRWDGGVATTAAPAEYIAPGESSSWVAQSGYLPTSQINAIASATTAITLVYA